MSDERVRGVAVHAAARILAEAGSGEVLVSGTTRDLAEGAARLAFESRGRYHLKGLEREHDLFAAASGDPDDVHEVDAAWTLHDQVVTQPDNGKTA